MLNYTVRPISDRSAFNPAHRVQSQFTVKWSQVLDLLEREYLMLNGKHLVIEVDVSERDIRNDGQFRANAKSPSPAVRVAFESKHGPIIMATDRFTRPPWRTSTMDDWQHNVYAIALALEALRKVDRYGVSRHGEQYKGYKAIEGAGPDLEGAREIINNYSGLDLLIISRMTIHDVFAQARRKTHPDANNGDRAAWDDVEAAGKLLGLL